MTDKFEKFFTPTLNDILEEHVSTLTSQEEIDNFYKKYEEADFSDQYDTMIYDVSDQMVEHSKPIMHENSLFFRSEEVWRSLYELNIIASFISKYGEKVAESYISSRNSEDRYEWTSEHSAITLAQLTVKFLTVYPSGDALLAAFMINKWVDVVREVYFKTHNYIFSEETKLYKLINFPL